MDTVTKLAEQTSDEMREEIDSTRSDLADKLGALEERVMGTVQSAQETVEDSIQIAKDTVASVKRTFDITHHVEQYPWPMLGGCFLAGLALGTLFQRAWRRSEPTPDRQTGKQPAYSPGPALPADLRGNGSMGSAAPQPRSQPQPPSRPGVFDLFHDEIAQVQGMAIGYVMGLARDAMKDAVPQWASQIDGLMNSVTTKLGGEPTEQHST
jgi:ElaB/YqjD/DUF883 family membrane-anchored ribosome-binding protein